MTPVSALHRVAQHALTAHGGGRLSADERRAEIVEVAVTAFAAGGLHGTSTEDIARLAGISQPYLFRLFGTKKELFIAAVGRAMDRIGYAFEEAAKKPAPDVPEGANPELYAMGWAYHKLLTDRALLRMQLHAFAACDDPDVRAYVRERFSGLVHQVAELSGMDQAELREFFAEGMLMNAAAAMELSEADVAWQKMCEGEDQPTA